MNPITVLAGLGAISGAIAALLLFYLPEAWRYEPFFWLEIFPGSIMPGLVFGLIVGLALYRRGLLMVWSYAAYIVASTLSYLAAYTLAAEVLADAFNNLLVVGLIAGLFGSAGLTAFTALVIPAVRQAKPSLLMLLAGCLLGGFLPLPFEFDGLIFWMLFFAVWQAGYAAALGSALSKGKY